jgi:hypothetical protein
MDRKLFKYIVTLTRPGDGTVEEVEFDTYWSPEHGEILTDVGVAAAATRTLQEPRGRDGNPINRWAPVAARVA